MTAEETIATASKYILGLLTLGGGAAGVAWAIMNAWGKSWLDNHFNKRLELFKHEQTKEIERIKAGLNTTFDRAQRLHQLEFDAIPTLWAAIVSAYDGAKVYASSFQTYPEVSKLDDEALIWVMDDMGLNPIQSKKVLSDTNRQEAFTSCVNFVRTSNMHTNMADMLRLYKNSTIYFDDELIGKVDKLIDLISSAVREHEFNISRNSTWKDEAEENLRKSGDELLKDVQDAFSTRMKSFGSRFPLTPPA